MKTEHEVKILDIDVDSIRNKLKALGAQAKGTKRFLRNTYDLPGEDHRWLRLRTDGEKTTITLKERAHDGVDGTKELELSVGSFEEMHHIITLLGITLTSTQENYRESHLLDDAQIEIDSWPDIPPYLEVEAKDEATVKKTVKELGFSWNKTTTKTTYDVYKHYGKDITKQKEVRFTSTSSKAA